MAQDRFANIAENDTSQRESVLRTALLKENEPLKFEKLTSALVDAENNIPTVLPHDISTKEELYEVLDRARRTYTPFLENHAPELKSQKIVIPIKHFVLNDTEHITIPYYGGPLGNALHKYEAEFDLADIPMDKAVYICFGGADYKANVYINDYCVGMHEGFFAPFEFEITDWVKKGKNNLKIALTNDHIYMGNSKKGESGKDMVYGDKLYAATGLGYDDAEIGWHHCPPGMGIYNYVRVEIRNRLSITDLFVRPILEKNRAEAWIEVENADYEAKTISFSLSVYGQNFQKEVFSDYIYEPYFCYEQEKFVNKHERSISSFSLDAHHGNNLYKITFDMGSDVRIWDLETPYLYQLQVQLYCEGKLEDTGKQQFGMRSFSQDTDSNPKGMFYLNGRRIRLRGANTMGFEQQDVLRGDFKQLIDDILLAKICNMNFWRLTQRPVQDEVYEYCDKLGLMTQTDLPLFSVMRRTKFAEGLRQTEEMVKLVRKHPCNIVVSYINEPTIFGAAQPHRNLLRGELEDFFEACDKIVKLNSPDSVIKHVDGDYDPPSRTTLPDNHCYTLWYNGHGIDFGKMYKGYWIKTLPDWYCGCGEFGSEGLDFKDLMQRRYPSHWLKEPFDPANIVNAQVAAKHGKFYDTPSSWDEWIEVSQNHQAFATRIMTEAMRRNARMVSYAIHLFIDAWPAGWMKTIMDCERTPKKAYFAYRKANEPILITLRSDRFTYFERENISIETYISNDIDKDYFDCKVTYELCKKDELIKTSCISTDFKACDVIYVANAEFRVDSVNNREEFVLRAILSDSKGHVLSSNEFSFEVFEDVEVPDNDEIVYIDNLDVGEHEIAGEKVTIFGSSYNKTNYVSCNTGHPAVREFKKDDFKYWYDKKEDMITPIFNNAIFAKGFNTVLKGFVFDRDFCKSDLPEFHAVVAEKVYEGKRYVISTLDLRTENPVAKRFKKAIYEEFEREERL